MEKETKEEDLSTDPQVTSPQSQGNPEKNQEILYNSNSKEFEEKEINVDITHFNEQVISEESIRFEIPHSSNFNVQYSDIDVTRESSSHTCRFKGCSVDPEQSNCGHTHSFHKTRIENTDTVYIHETTSVRNMDQANRDKDVGATSSATLSTNGSKHENESAPIFDNNIPSKQNIDNIVVTEPRRTEENMENVAVNFDECELDDADLPENDTIENRSSTLKVVNPDASLHETHHVTSSVSKTKKTLLQIIQEAKISRSLFIPDETDIDAGSNTAISSAENQSAIGNLPVPMSKDKKIVADEVLTVREQKNSSSSLEHLHKSIERDKQASNLDVSENVLTHETAGKKSYSENVITDGNATKESFSNNVFSTEDSQEEPLSNMSHDDVNTAYQSHSDNLFINKDTHEEPLSDHVLINNDALEELISDNACFNEKKSELGLSDNMFINENTAKDSHSDNVFINEDTREEPISDHVLVNKDTQEERLLDNVYVKKDTIEEANSDYTCFIEKKSKGSLSDNIFINDKTAKESYDDVFINKETSKGHVPINVLTNEETRKESYQDNVLVNKDPYEEPLSDYVFINGETLKEPHLNNDSNLNVPKESLFLNEKASQEFNSDNVLFNGEASHGLLSDSVYIDNSDSADFQSRHGPEELILNEVFSNVPAPVEPFSSDVLKSVQDNETNLNDVFVNEPTSKTPFSSEVLQNVLVLDTSVKDDVPVSTRSSSKTSDSSLDRKPSVHFSDIVLVDTYSSFKPQQTSSSKDFDNHFPPQNETLSQRPNEPGPSYSYKERSFSSIQNDNLASTVDSAENNQTNVFKRESFKRKDSTGHVQCVSPTDLLRKKQKQVTDQIMKSYKSKPKNKDPTHLHKGNLYEVSNDSLNNNPDSVTDTADECGLSHAPSVEYNKVLSAYEIQRHLEPCCTHPGTQQIDRCEPPTTGLAISLGNRRNYSEKAGSETQQGKHSLGTKSGIQMEENEKSIKQPKYSSTSSQLLQKIIDREEGEKIYPGYGHFSYSTPSEMLYMSENREDKESLKSEPTPSQLFRKTRNREINEQAGPGYGNFSYTTPSEMLYKSRVEEVRESLRSDPTPSQLLRKTIDREINEQAGPGYGNFSYTTPSELLYKSENGEEKESLRSDPTPSQLFRKTRNREINEQTGPGYGNFSYTTPCEMLFKVEIDKDDVPKLAQIQAQTKEIYNQNKPDFENRFQVQSEYIQSTSHHYQDEDITQIESSERQPGNDEAENKVKFKKRYPYDKKPGAWFFRSSSDDSAGRVDSIQSSCQSIDRNNFLDTYGSLSKESTASFNDAQDGNEDDYQSQESIDSLASENLDVSQVDLSNPATAIQQLNIIQANFLQMLEKKREIGEPITYEDYQELTLIKRVIEAVVIRVAKTTMTISGNEKQVELLEKNPDVSIEEKSQIANKLKQDIAKLAILIPNSEKESTKIKTFESQSDKHCNRETMGPVKKELHSMTEVYSALKSPKSKPKLKTKLTSSCGETVNCTYDFEPMRYPSTKSTDSNDYLTDGTHYKLDSYMGDSEMFGSRFTMSPSISIDDNMFTSSPDSGTSHYSSGGKQSLCECNECKRKWFYWNERLDKDLYHSYTNCSNISKIPEVGTRMTNAVSMTSSVTPYPSSMAITPNQSFADSSDEENESTAQRRVTLDELSIESHETDSLAMTNPSTASDVSVGELSPRKINMTTSVTFPDDVVSMQVDIGPARVRATKDSLYYDYLEGDEEDHHDETEEQQYLKEGSPDRSQKLYGSSQALDRARDGGIAKRKQAGRSLTPDSKFMMDKEVVETQNRKLQSEVSTLQTENKLLKEKYNRSQSRIEELENQLSLAQEDVTSLQESLNQEVSSLSTRTQQEIDRGRDDLQSRIVALTKENETLKAEVASLEKQLDSSHRTVDMVRHNTEKTRTLEAHKQEISSLKEELGRVKALLEQSERHLQEEEERHSEVSKQVIKLTELKHALQQQQDSDTSGTVGDKQLKSLEKRLKVTEERLHQERADRANNLSAVEDKLLTENARLQAAEKDLTRQLHREKEKNRNFDHRVKTLRDENEKLRLAMPFDDARLLEDKKNYDIPYSSHSNQRAETVKHISDDMNYILSQIEKQDGLQSKENSDEMIRTLWNKRELAYRQLQEYALHFEELQLKDNIMDGLKNLRDTYGQTESKLKSMEEQVEDAQAQMITLEATYKEQLNLLVRERHDAFARLKTAEDILEAVRAENEILRHNTHMVQAGASGKSTLHNGVSGSVEGMQMELTNLESKVAQLTRANQRLEGELNTAKSQLDARNKTLQDVQSELDLTYNRLKGGDNDDRKQSKIDKLSSEISGLQLENKLITDKFNHTVAEKSRLESELASLRKTAETQKARQHKSELSESKVVQQLRDEITEKESRVTGLTKQLEDLENDLQKNRQELYIEQMHNSELETETESLRQTVDQRAHMFEALSGTEREQLAQYQILKDTLDSVNQELAQKHAQIIALDVNLSGQKDRTEELESELEKLRKHKPSADDSYTEEEQGSAQQLRISELEKERSQLKQELVQAYNAIKAAEEQYRTLQTESAQLEQELVKEKTVILQITAEKGEIEQHLEELAEEHDSLIQEKNQCEEDLIKLETKLQEILQKYEAEARKQHADFQREYPDLPIEARKVVAELDSLKLLLDGKDREIGMQQDKINRQQIDIEFLHRKVELVHNDSISNREDVARMISELTLKMKEAVSMREVNQFLVAERTKLQNEKAHAEVELEQERKHNDQRKREISDVLRKVQGTETRQKTTEKDNREKENLIANLEADLNSTKNNYSSVEAEMKQLKNTLDNQNRDLNNLTCVNETIEKQLEMEKNMLMEERSALSELKEEFNRVSHDFELLQHEHNVLSDKHKSDTQTIEHLRETLSARDEENSKLQEELHGTKIDLESQKGQLLITKDTVQKLSQDKGSIYQDYEGMCRTVTEKERQLVELKDRTDERLDHIQKQHVQERLSIEQDKETAVQDCQMYKRELDSAKEQLEQKEVQLNTFGKTLQELEAITRQKNTLEAQLRQLESSTGDSKVLLEGQRKELMALNEALAKQQDRTTRIEAENHTLKADLKSLKDAANRESQELSLTIKELKSQHENERTYLNDNLAKTQTQLHKLETSLVNASSERDTLQAQKHMTEKTVEELQAQLSDESTGRRLAEQSVGQLRLQLEDMRNDKNVCEARYVEMKNQLDRAEDQLKSEQTKHQKLSVRLQEVTALSHNSETSAKAKAEQIETLQKEISRLKQMIESQRQNMTGKMKKASLEFKQQLDLVQEDRDKLLIQVQKLSTDLEACREQLALKNKDNLKLQEDNLVLEDGVRESKAKQKQAEETLKVETEKLTSMANKFMEQDEELKRLRNFLAKKAEDSGEADKSMWQEMNRVIQDLSRQMHDHLDAQKSEGKDGSSHSQVVLRYKKQLAEMQGELSTEKSLHQITKTSLQALEEDCQRLRLQLHAFRRRDTSSSEKKSKSPSPRKYKNRTEAINALIARSQTQAQAILASGGYYDNMNSPRVPQSARAAYHSPQRPESPDNSYSEDLSIASLPPLHYGSSSKQ